MQAGFAFFLLGETSFETRFALLRMRIYSFHLILRRPKAVSQDQSEQT